jgi:hypothetical protein
MNMLNVRESFCNNALTNEMMLVGASFNECLCR